MGAIRLIYDETERKFKKLGWWGELSLDRRGVFRQSQIVRRCRFALGGR